MIKREQLIEAWMDITSENTPEEFEKLIWDWLNTHYYSDVLEYLQLIINELWLSFWINELWEYGTIAYQEWQAADWERRINHIWNVAMQYDSIDKLLEELNKFEEQCN
jgi:hypothetical protein